MAGICTTGGLTVDADGKLGIQGARPGAWPSEGSCPIAANNGLRLDTVSGNLWVAPPGDVLQKVTAGVEDTATPTLAGSFQIAHLEHEQVVPACADAQFVAHLSGGFIEQRMANGNWWTVQRYLTLYVNGIAVAFTGTQDVATLENNSGGTLSGGGAVDSTTIIRPVTAGQTVKLVAHYEHNRLAFTAGGANGYVWRSPSIVGQLFTHP